MDCQSRPLHNAFPGVASAVPHRPIAALPTPLGRLEDAHGSLLVKRDGLTHDGYGGNKVRKLEYLLAQALDHDCQRIATFGAAGSNHATATAIHAHRVGLGCINFLSRQRPTPWVAGNLQRQLSANAKIIYVDGNRAERERQANEFLQHQPGRTWRIPMGGSSIAGTFGYVNAGFELAEQLTQQANWRPDRLYVPLGTMGTAVGLAIGLRAAGWRLPIVAVRVVHQTVGSMPLAQRLFEKTVRALRFLDSRFPSLGFEPDLFQVRHDQFGQGYAAATEAGQRALLHAKQAWQLDLETTYTAKTMAALLHDRQAGATRRPIYWATYAEHRPCARNNLSQSQLPEPLRQYGFTGPTTP